MCGDFERFHDLSVETTFLGSPKHCQLFEVGFGIEVAHYYSTAESWFVKETQDEIHFES